jgi:hypothetical protein
MSTQPRDGENVQARGASFGFRHAAPGRVPSQDSSGHIDRPYVAFRGIVPFVIIQLIVIVCVAALPTIAT